MSVNQERTLKGLPLKVTANVAKNDEINELKRRHEGSDDHQNTRNIEKRRLSNTDLGIKKPIRKVEYDNEEMVLRDRLLEEIDSLEESLPQSCENRTNSKEIPVEGNSNEETIFSQDRKIVKLKGKLPNLALPEGWLALNHRSGGIIYLHRISRVCTWSRPYYIGKGSVRKHDVPIAAIPCLHQRKALEMESKQQQFQNDSSSEQQLLDYNSGSVLNFINTAGAPLENDEMQQNYSAVNRTSVQDFQKGGSQIEENVHGINIGISGKTGDGDGKGNDDISSDNSSCSTNSGNDRTDGISESEYGHNEENERHPYVGNESIVSETFCPKDGLDVINETLNVQSLLKTQNSSTKLDNPSQSVALPSSSNSETDLETAWEAALEQTNECLRFSNEFCDINKLKSNIKPVNASDTEMKSVAGNKKRINEVPKDNQIVFSQSKSFKSWERSKKSTNFSTQNTDKKPICENTVLNSGIELIASEELSVYLEKLFDFEELTQEQEQNVAITSVDQSSEQAESTLPAVLECLPYCVKGINARQNKEWVLNPGGKTPVAILHEYSQAVLKEKPEYVFSECDNPATPFMAEVQINGITHGSGVAPSKKQAKQVAAEATLQVFLPDEFHIIRDYEISPEQLKYFDNLKIDNPNVYEVSIKLGLPSPSQVLQECLKRNQGVCSSIINFKIIPGETGNQNHSYRISCGKHTAEGFCKNKKTGKQLASQALLKKLHPHISTWGSLLRIYCDRPSTIVKKYKTTNRDDFMTRQHSLPQDTAPRGDLILARLKQEMKKISNDAKGSGQSNPRMKAHAQTPMTNPISTVDA